MIRNVDLRNDVDLALARLEGLLAGYAQPGGASAVSVGGGVLRLGASAVGAVQTVDVTALTPGPNTSFTVSFAGSAPATVNYTGTQTTDIQNLVNALDSLTTIGGVSPTSPSNVGGSVSVTVAGAGVAQLAISGAPSTTQANQGFSITVTAEDAAGKGSVAGREPPSVEQLTLRRLRAAD